MQNSEKAVSPISDDEKVFEKIQGAIASNNYGDMMTEMLKDPQFLSSLQLSLGGLVGGPADYISTLPKVVKRRIKALKKLQLEHTKLEAKFYEEVHGIESKYAALYAPLYEKRHLITDAKIEPTDDDCDFPSEEEESIKEVSSDGQSEEEKEKIDENTKGVPEFWSTLLKNIDLLADIIQEHDEPILKHLINIKVNITNNPMGFSLEFHFEPNEFFANTLLTKEYEMSCLADEDDPFSFEGPEIVKCKGCPIDWKEGKNVTVVIKEDGTETENESFFDFFSPPSIADDEEFDQDSQALLEADFELGHYIRERVVPRAVLFFTGEALEDEDYDDEDEDEVEEEEED